MRVQTLATSETGTVHDKGGWCFVEEWISTVINELLGDMSSAVGNEQYMLAKVTEDQEREDVSTTASDGDRSARWLKVCKKRLKKKEKKKKRT